MAWTKHIRSAVLCGGVAFAAAGCKSSGSGGSSASRDPIFGGEKIPSPGVPVPGQYGAARKDPLMKGSTTTGRGEGEPFRQSAATIPAALAGAHSTAETDTLAFNRDKLKGEIVPVSATASSGDAAEQIRSRGGRLYAAVKLPSGDYEVRCAVPVGASGAMRSYAAIAATQPAAMRDLIVQVRADEKR